MLCCVVMVVVNRNAGLLLMDLCRETADEAMQAILWLMALARLLQ